MSFKGKTEGIAEFESREGYDLYAENYVKDEEFLNTFDQELLLRHTRSLAGKKILDAGAGTGRLVPFLKKRKAENVTALDISTQMLEVASQRRLYEELIKADLVEELPFDYETFDMILSSLVVVHIQDRYLPQVFAEFYRILKPGGELYLVNIPQRKPPKLEAKGQKFFITSYPHSDKTIKAYLEEVGFQIKTEATNVEKGDAVATLFIAGK